MSPQEIDALVSRLAQEDNREALQLAESLAYAHKRLYCLDEQRPTPTEHHFLLDARLAIVIRLNECRRLVANACAPWFEVQS